MVCVSVCVRGVLLVFFSVLCGGVGVSGVVYRMLCVVCICNLFCVLGAACCVLCDVLWVVRCVLCDLRCVLCVACCVLCVVVCVLSVMCFV